MSNKTTPTSNSRKKNDVKVYPNGILRKNGQYAGSLPKKPSSRGVTPVPQRPVVGGGSGIAKKPLKVDGVARIKPPRVPHLPNSNGLTVDDVKHLHLPSGITSAKKIVVTAKMDGENTTLYPDGYCHARSVTQKRHPSRSYVMGLAAKVGQNIPDNWRVCGENLYAKHTVKYENLESFFLVHSIWDGRQCLSWEETEMWCELLGLQPVSKIYKGSFTSLSDIHKLFRRYCADKVDPQEGYVVRNAESFTYDEFGENVGKWVQKGFIQTGTSWLHSSVERNGLRQSDR